MADVNDPFNQEGDNLYDSGTDSLFGASSTLGLGGIPSSTSGVASGSGLPDLGLSNNQFSTIGEVPTLENIAAKQGNYLDSARANLDYNLKKQQDFDNSFMGKAQPYLKGASLAMNTAKSGFDIWQGFEQLDIAKDMRDIASEKWEESKVELARIKGVRKKINASYVS